MKNESSRTVVRQRPGMMTWLLEIMLVRGSKAGYDLSKVCKKKGGNSMKRRVFFNSSQVKMLHCGRK